MNKTKNGRETFREHSHGKLSTVAQLHNPEYPHRWSTYTQKVDTVHTFILVYQLGGVGAPLRVQPIKRCQVVYY